MVLRAGDKEPAFLGSRSWVGAIELSFVMDELLGVTCKIINVAKGSDLPGHAREIAHHFDTQGTVFLASWFLNRAALSLLPSLLLSVLLSLCGAAWLVRQSTA